MPTLVVLAVTGLALAACGDGSDDTGAAAGSPEGSASASKPTTITDVEFANAAAIDHGTIFAALEQGYFLDNGIKANVTLYPTGVEITNQVASGGADFGALAASVALTAQAKGLPISIVAMNHGDATATSYAANQAIVAGPSAGVAEGDVGALKGKKIGVAVGTSPQAYLASKLAANGLTEADVTIQNIAPPDMIGALQQGSIDAFVTFEPGPTRALEQVPGSVLVVRGEAEGWYDPGVLIANTQWITDNPGPTEQVLAAHAKSAQLVREDPDAVAEVSTRWIDGLSLELASQAIRYPVFDPRLSQAVLTGLSGTTLPFLVQNNAVPADFDPADAIAASPFAAMYEANADLFEDLEPLSSGDLLQ